MKIVKKFGKALLCQILERQVRELRARHRFSVVAVAGSVGKTSTKFAVAQLLGSQLRVRYQSGNYNDRLTVPLVFFDEAEPGLFNVIRWLQLLRRNSRQIKGDYPYDVVVVELGTDGPGQMAQFSYVQPEIGVLTAISPEHMAFFKTMDAVAIEELTLADYSKKLLVNVDDVAPRYLDVKIFTGYGTLETAQYRASDIQLHDLGNATANFQLDQAGSALIKLPFIGEQGAKITLAAAAVAAEIGLSLSQIQAGIEALNPVPGRMQILRGVNGSLLIDDTYNASPLAVCAALDVLYAAKASQKIAILGSMNELGDTSPSAHEEVGRYCQKDQLDLIVTIGHDAETYLAPIAKQNGCIVMCFDSPYEAGAYVRTNLKNGAIVLAKGSQNRVFAEEALKSLLAERADDRRLVRQSAYWMGVKRRQFGDPTP